MRYIVFSDIHGNSYALEAMLKDIEDISFDSIIFLGDVFGYYYDQGRVLKLLSSMDNLVWLRGNHDTYFVEALRSDNQEYISSLTDRYGHSYEMCLSNGQICEFKNIIEELTPCIELYDGSLYIGAFHGTPDDPLEGRLYPDGFIPNIRAYEGYDIVLLGHTHFRMFRKHMNTVIINPGSIGQPRDGNEFGYCILDTDNRSVLFRDIIVDKRVLYDEIDRHDPVLNKLKDVLERESGKDSIAGVFRW